LFNSVYVSSEPSGTLAPYLADNEAFDVIILDDTDGGRIPNFDVDDLAALRDFYETKSNLVLDGTLYIRNINFNSFTDFPVRID
jgi:hypothetical protein